MLGEHRKNIGTALGQHWDSIRTAMDQRIQFSHVDAQISIRFWIYVGPPSTTSAQHRTSIGSRYPMLYYCWPIVYDAGPALNQHWFNILCLDDNSLTNGEGGEEIICVKYAATKWHVRASVHCPATLDAEQCCFNVGPTSATLAQH